MGQKEMQFKESVNLDSLESGKFWRRNYTRMARQMGFSVRGLCFQESLQGYGKLRARGWAGGPPRVYVSSVL